MTKALISPRDSSSLSCIRYTRISHPTPPRVGIGTLACMQAFQRRETSGERSEPRGEWGEGEKELSLSPFSSRLAFAARTFRVAGTPACRLLEPIQELDLSLSTIMLPRAHSVEQNKKKATYMPTPTPFSSIFLPMAFSIFPCVKENSSMKASRINATNMLQK